jgi:tetratricopeptide (TPR) repeat protein
MRIQSLHDLHFSFPDIDGYWDTQDLEKTEKRIRTQLPTSGTSATSLQIEAMTQMARLVSLQGKLKEAREFLVFSEALLKALSPSERQRVQTRYYLEEGRYYCLSMFPSRALDSFQKAWELSSKDQKLDVLAIDAAYMISITVPAKQGKEWLQIAILRAEASKEHFVRSWLAYLYMATGWQAFDTHEYSRALGLFEKAQANSANEPPLFIRTLKWCSARCLRGMDQYEKSLQIQQEISDELSALGESNGYVFLEMAECYQALQQSEKARAHFELAFEKLKIDKWYSDNFDHDLTRIQKKSKKPSF